MTTCAEGTTNPCETCEHGVGHAALAQRAARSQLLAEVSQQFASVLPLPELLATITHRLGDTLGGGCCVWLASEEAPELGLALAATYHPSPGIFASCSALLADGKVTLGATPVASALATGKPLLETTVDRATLTRDAPEKFTRLIELLGVETFLSVPLRARGQVLGAISMCRNDPRRPYTPLDRELVQELADRAGLAIDNALLVAALERRTADLEQANRRLRRSELLLRRLTGSGIIGIGVCDLAGHLHEVNDVFLTMIGYTRADHEAGLVSGPTLGLRVDDPTLLPHLQQLQREGVATPWERELVRKDGTRIPVLVGAARLDEHEILAFALDLRELRAAEARARASAAHKASVMEAALEAIVLMDADGYILDFNEAAERTFGYRRTEAVGHKLADLIVPEGMRDAHQQGLGRYLASGAPRVLGRRLEVTAMRRGGERFAAEIAIVRIAADGPAVFTGYIRDITERKQAAAAELLRREKEAAEAANLELEAFSYSVAHDLRTPLRAINGFSTALHEDYGHLLDAAGRGLLQRVRASTRRMGDLIDALLALARLSRVHLDWQPGVDLVPIATSIVEHLRELEPRREVELVVPARLLADGDPHLLRALLENLLGNAWKFTRGRHVGRIELGVTEGPEGRRIFVRDNGAGFDMAYAGKLFAPFQRLHGPAEFEGSGVGLATVQRIVRSHGGEVAAEGVVDGGATFWFTLGSEAVVAPKD